MDRGTCCLVKSGIQIWAESRFQWTLESPENASSDQVTARGCDEGTNFGVQPSYSR